MARSTNQQRRGDDDDTPVKHKLKDRNNDGSKRVCSLQQRRLSDNPKLHSAQMAEHTPQPACQAVTQNRVKAHPPRDPPRQCSHGGSQRRLEQREEPTRPRRKHVVVDRVPEITNGPQPKTAPKDSRGDQQLAAEQAEVRGPDTPGKKGQQNDI